MVLLSVMSKHTGGQVGNMQHRSNQSSHHYLYTAFTMYTALQKFGNALEKWGFGQYHTSKLCKSYLERKQSAGIMSVMEWPPQSPDLNPIELLGTGP